MDYSSYQSCELCPRQCRVNRLGGDPKEPNSVPARPGSASSGPGSASSGPGGASVIQPGIHAMPVSRASTGFCGCGPTVKVARAALHQWEEPCISGFRGSGTVFFTGCTLRCCFCQNYSISQEGFGKEITDEKLADIFLRLQDQGAHNINLVTATQYLPSVLKALDSVKQKLTIPIVYNCGGYERVETVKALADYVDIWLPDLKYCAPELSARYSAAPDYFEAASAAVVQMIKQTGPLTFQTVYEEADLNTPATQGKVSAGGDCPASGFTDSTRSGRSLDLMTKGVIIRHMVLPGAKDDSIRLLHWIKENLPEGQFYVSLLSQYTPFYKSCGYPEINRRITSYEYYQVVDAAIELGLTHGFMQEKSSAKEEYTPPFNLEGID